MTIQTELKNLSHRTQIGDFLNARGLTGKGVEVGTLYGAHATDILKTWKGHLYCVDPWKNQPGDVYFDGANKLDMEKVYAQAVATLGPKKNCTLVRMMSLNAVGMFDDGELDFFYDDGNHGLPHVRADIAAWWPKVKIGGVFSGHDYFTRYDNDTDSDAGTAVAELAEAIGVRAHVTWDTSWWFIKTKEADDAFRKAHIERRLPNPVWTDNRNLKGMAVVLPVAKFDWNLAVKWLAWWTALLDGQPNPYHTIAYCSPDLEREHLDALGDTGLPNLSIVVGNDIKEIGYFGSPNQVFKGALTHVEKALPGYATLWCEADTVPMGAGWVQEIEKEYRACGRPFMGDVYRAHGAVPHMTGNAVYHPDWRTLAPSLAALGKEECGWDTLAAHDSLPRSHAAKTIQQVWRPPLPITAEWVKKNIRPECELFHQCKDGSLIDLLCEQTGRDPIPLAPALCKSTYETQRHSIPAQTGPSATVGVPRFTAAPVAANFPAEILYVTFARDMDFLRYSLKSAEKYATGFAGIKVAVPSSERGQYDWVTNAEVVYFDEVPGKGMLHQQIIKCRADEICPQASHILHMDADCFFWRKCSPSDFMSGTNPIMLTERYAEIKNPNRMLWQKAAERALGWSPEFETMVAHPQMHIREVYAKMRSLMENRHGKFDDYVLSCRNEFPQSFAEFPTLGAVALEHYRDRYDPRPYDLARDLRECRLAPDTNCQYVYRNTRDAVVECWSHGGIERYRSNIEAWLAGKTPKHFIK